MALYVTSTDECKKKCFHDTFAIFLYMDTVHLKPTSRERENLLAILERFFQVFVTSYFIAIQLPCNSRGHGNAANKVLN